MKKINNEKNPIITDEPKKKKKGIRIENIEYA